MTNISKKALKKKDADALFVQFASIISKLNTDSSQTFLQNVLTKSERIMLMKRIAAILMLSKGYSTYKVWTLLNISSSTAKHYAAQYEQGAYSAFLTSLNKPRSSLLKEVEQLLDNIIAPMGKDRWRYLR